MSVTASFDLNEALYVPFMQDVRGGPDGKSPVGTLASIGTDTGDVSGGTVNIKLLMTRMMFGFRAVLAPTLLMSSDNLASPEAVNLKYQSSGNRRVNLSIDQAELAIAAFGGNFAHFEESGIVLESDLLVATSVLEFIWSTNTDGKVYSARGFFAVFDLELIEAQGSISDFLAGIR